MYMGDWEDKIVFVAGTIMALAWIFAVSKGWI